VISACKVAGFASSSSRLPASGRATRRRRRRRRLPVRHDARVRRGEPAREDRHAGLRDFVAINKFDRKGAQDALRDVRKQVQRNREQFNVAPDEMPVLSEPNRGSLQRRRRDGALPGAGAKLGARA